MAEAKNITTVTMLDGRVVDFPGKRKLQKTYTIGEDGTVVVKLDFINGETRIFTIPPAELPKVQVQETWLAGSRIWQRK